MGQHVHTVSLFVSACVYAACARASSSQVALSPNAVNGQGVAAVLLPLLFIALGFVYVRYNVSVAQWVVALMPVSCALLAREWFVVRLLTCCPQTFAPLFSSAFLLVLAVPMHALASQRYYTLADGFVSCGACFVLFLSQHDFVTTCEPVCHVQLVCVAVLQSGALALLYHRAGCADNVVCVPGLLLGVAFALSYLASGTADVFAGALQCVATVVLANAVVWMQRDEGGHGLPDIVACIAAGGCMVELLLGSSTVRSVIIICFFAALLAKLSCGDKGGGVVSTGFVVVLSCGALLFMFLTSQGSTHFPNQRASIDVPYRYPERAEPGKLLNATVIMMDSQRKPLLRSIDLLQDNFLTCFPYPLHVFVEGVNEEYQRQVQQRTTSLVTFLDVAKEFSTPPNGIPMETVRFWIEVQKSGRGHHFGYRMMCRFFAGVFAQLPFLKGFEFYLRLDTDSYFRQPVLVDPFSRMVTEGCSYGYMQSHQAHTDAADVTTDLYDTTMEWVREAGVPKANVTRMKKELISRGVYNRKMFYNNFEVGAVALLSGNTYQSFFRHLDETDGFLKYRWGDAPVRTLAMHLLLSPPEMCSFEKYLPYQHGRYKNKVYHSTGMITLLPIIPSHISHFYSHKKTVLSFSDIGARQQWKIRLATTLHNVVKQSFMLQYT